MKNFAMAMCGMMMCGSMSFGHASMGAGIAIVGYSRAVSVYARGPFYAGYHTSSFKEVYRAHECGKKERDHHHPGAE
jgi:hypothetical protein